MSSVQESAQGPGNPPAAPRPQVQANQPQQARRAQAAGTRRDATQQTGTSPPAKRVRSNAQANASAQPVTGQPNIGNPAIVNNRATVNNRPTVNNNNVRPSANQAGVNQPGLNQPVVNQLEATPPPGVSRFLPTYQPVFNNQQFTILIWVGVQHTAFFVDLEQIRPYSNQLYAWMVSAKRQGTRLMTLRDEDPATFSNFIKWTGDRVLFDGLWLPDLAPVFKLWHFAERHTCPELKSDLLLYLQSWLGGNRAPIPLSTIQYVYASSRPGSMMRKMVAEVNAWRLGCVEFRGTKTVAPREYIEDLAEGLLAVRTVCPVTGLAGDFATRYLQVQAEGAQAGNAQAGGVQAQGAQAGGPHAGGAQAQGAQQNAA
ncbi:uncharacterized protein BO97DRAFT_458575 [Aspergillus homomorphus CBS 101889]|uniref:BTB domain-containing protein n=1 Tax=Aspergillus homomorphus (strain CBS 101889) TaxID=1450537 RepID=A0A395I730_ASPHC|nr:hypothetical protein BO97DRAFT_458575 [Aspergillus homomorphus CBS 101889]RAL15706.1 hypothetical protein BO97DRAFT_458575 [Aspergillus homomorphus CBS 101889]